ncbi:MAG: serine/threonine protein phosphatase [Lachnospiraceae bacterium]|nr:serine/threonine protein phosphatase [Lachnospiraceae bacterium]
MHYVIGDVHGCYDEMMTLLDKIETMDSDAQIYFVGDFIDRGPKVDKVLEWCMTHITADGKYQSVRGNHEQMVLDWYREEWLSWWAIGGFSNPYRRGMPETYYDFSKWMESMGKLAPESLQPYMDFFDSLPYHITLELETVWGKKVLFRIVHAYYEHNDLPEDQQHDSNLWMRMDCGNLESDDILVHGHTPTLNLDYMLWAPKDTAPGMISYRKNDINIDGGCVFAESFPAYPDFLCAIRLEDLLEIYPCTVEERFMQFVGNDADRELQLGRSNWYQERYMARENRYRLQILEQMGKFDR